VALELHGQLGVFAIAFAHKDGAFTVLGVADVLALLRLIAPCAWGMFIAGRASEPAFPPKKRAMLSIESGRGGAPALPAFAFGADS